MRSLISDELDEELNSLQIDIASKGIPVAIVFEGGSGRVISRIVNELDRVLEPMGINYHHFDAAKKGTESAAELLKATPGKGEITLYDRSWYSLFVDRYDGDENTLKNYIGIIRNFEEYLLDNGTYLIKIGLKGSSAELKKYADEYRPHTALHNTFLSVDHIDRVKFNAVMPSIVEETDTKRAPWDIVDVGNIEDTVCDTVEIINKRLKQCLKEGWDKNERRSVCSTYPNPRKGLKLDLDSDGYKSRMEELSDEIERLQILLAISGRSLTLCFEGWDAAGKGGCIKHVCHALNPRGYNVARVKAPTSEDYAHTYLWRFARSLPKAGNVSVFDRTWYGRMMVEPIEGFCDEDEYNRSAEEINTFEKFLSCSGGIILKFWLDIDKDTQLQRFNDRKNDPLKKWKLTDEDWRNREKWDVYEQYVDAMISSTNTPYAPWIAVPANNKKAARLIVLETVVEVLKKELEQ